MRPQGPDARRSDETFGKYRARLRAQRRARDFSTKHPRYLFTSKVITLEKDAFNPNGPMIPVVEHTATARRKTIPFESMATVKDPKNSRHSRRNCRRAIELIGGSGALYATY